jgi:hypothetical protein
VISPFNIAPVTYEQLPLTSNATSPPKEPPDERILFRFGSITFRSTKRTIEKSSLTSMTDSYATTLSSEDQFELTAANSAKIIPAEFATLIYLRKRNRWDYFDEAADKRDHKTPLSDYEIPSKPRKPSVT